MYTMGFNGHLEFAQLLAQLDAQTVQVALDFAGIDPNALHPDQAEVCVND